MIPGAALVVLVACGPDASRLAEGLRSDNPAVREDMALRARHDRHPEVTAALVEALGDPSECIRLAVVQSLADRGHPSAAPALVSRLRIETSPAVKREVIDALGRIGDDGAVPSLLNLVESTPVDEVPPNVLWALGRIGDRRALPVLVRLREEATDPYVVYNANVALRRLE
ncbi:MAG: HEAT repeat domain-containing protein [Deltaproteobacteria bacterium]|nr:HEAT repeat domain-containing protein [Deltaproteobacteria bacterium]